MTLTPGLYLVVEAVPSLGLAPGDTFNILDAPVEPPGASAGELVVVQVQKAAGADYRARLEDHEESFKRFPRARQRHLAREVRKARK